MGRFFSSVCAVTTLLLTIQVCYGSDKEIHRSTRKLFEWSPYLDVPGQTSITICPGETLEVSMCPTLNSSDSMVNCFEDPYLELHSSTTETVVASNNDYCGFCPSLEYTFEALGSTCEVFTINAGCVLEGCGGVAGIRITTKYCELQNIVTTTPGNLPLLDCELLEEYQSSICDFGGESSVISGGNYRNPCSLVGNQSSCNMYGHWQPSLFFACTESSIPTNSPTPFPADFHAFIRNPQDPLSFTFEANLSGNHSVCSGPFSISGELNSISVNFNFAGARSDSWAADMALGFYRENFPAFQIGGFDVTFPGVFSETHLVPWPESWKSPALGTYQSTVDLSMNNWHDTGDYRLCIMNAWTESNHIFYSGSMTFSYSPSTKYGFAVIVGDTLGGINENGILVDFIRDTTRNVIRPVTYVGNISDAVTLVPTGNHSLSSFVIAWRSILVSGMTYGPWMCSALIESGTLQYWLVSFVTEEVVGFILQDSVNDTPIFQIYFFGNSLSRRLFPQSSSSSSSSPSSSSIPFTFSPFSSSFTRSLSSQCDMGIVGVATVSSLRKFQTGISDQFLYLIPVPSLP